MIKKILLTSLISLNIPHINANSSNFLTQSNGSALGIVTKYKEEVGVLNE